jgi:hypothetical protein
MNLYLILAIAFGALTPAEAPVARRSSSAVVAARRAGRVAISRVHRVVLRREDGEGSSRFGGFFASLRTTLAPLTGAATPRAPAVTC